MEGYVCPSDRQLALRARLGTGWSTVAQTNQRRTNTRLSDEELDHIYRVLQRNESINERESRRVESMLKRLENMQVATTPQNKMACSICGHEFGLLLKSSTHCADCGRLVCNRCSMEFTEELPENPRLASDVSNVSPSKYLPPGSLGVSGGQRMGSRVLQRLWRSRQLSEQRDDPKEGLGPQDRSAYNGAVGARSKCKSFSLERRQSMSRLSNFFSIPLSLTPSASLTPTSNRFHLCKLCCEAREVWKKSGAWFHRGLPKCGLHSSCPASPLISKPITTVGGWTSLLARSPAELIPSTGGAQASDDDWTRIEKRPPKPVPTSEGVGSHSSFTSPSYSPEDVKSSLEEPSNSSSAVITNSGNSGGIGAITHPGSPHNLFESPTWKPSMEQQQRQHQTLLSSPTSKTDQKTPSQIHESLSGNSLHSTERSPQRGRESKVQSLFPETRLGLSLSDPKIAPSTFTLSPELKLNKGSPSCRKSAIPFSEAPLGILYFSVTHDATNCELHVRIHNAKHLIAMDANGLSDPFVVCQLLPPVGKRFRTRTIPQSLNPVWNETFTFVDFDNRKLEKKILRLAVLDADTFGADWLGEYRLGLGELLPDRLSEFAVPLNPRKPLSKEIDDVINPTRGKIQIALRFIEETKQLCVEILRCADLAPMDRNGLSDPFVKLCLRPDKLRKTKQKTKIKKTTLFPEFYEEFFFAMDALEVNKRTLEITVWDFDRGVRNDFIGGLTLGAKAKAERREVWQAVFRPPYRRFEAWFQLASRSDTEYPGRKPQTNVCAQGRVRACISSSRYAVPESVINFRIISILPSPLLSSLLPSFPILWGDTVPLRITFPPPLFICDSC
ncbi:synaptotagmin [Echinococcus multilocularis]|uniref:Synaptotagmin n=1 Tax=Echinococcus multilocularis TaxID=6211 RepID=A0A068YFJ8_ECHMU|nr:synaptotagmin [Echinococcus multilocularis]